MSILIAENINTGYDKKQVLFDINFNIQKGDCTLLVGSNGSGKSTLFKAIYRCLNLWDIKGKLILENEKLTEFQTNELIEKGIMYIPQKETFFEDLTVKENLELSVLHFSKKFNVDKKINEILEQIPILKNKLNQDVNKLSGGERKLVSLVMVLLNKPKVLLFDEPLSGLSTENVKLLIKHLTKIKETGTTLMLIEHRIKELLPLADQIIGLKLGHKTNQELKTLEHIKTFLL
jgi:branched-chain amino acid transport system ATP-binding protein